MQAITTIAIAPLVSLAVTAFLLAIFLRSKFLLKISDVPNERSLHATPVPRFGGLAIMAGSLISWAYVSNSTNWPVLISIVLLMGISFADDARGISIRWRFLAHFMAAGIFIYFKIYPAIPIAYCLLLMFVFVWMINLYNFMDGADGLAGGMALFGFSAYAVGAWMSGDAEFSLMNACVAAAALGFLFYNFNPAKVFMGDGGSIPLGFLAAAMGMSGWVKGLWPIWFPVMVFSPFIFDATVTIFQRFLRGEKIWLAHKEHYYQKLVQMGWGHRNTALAEYGLMFVTAVLAVWVSHMQPQLQLLFICLIIFVYLAMMFAISHAWRKHRADKVFSQT